VASVAVIERDKRAFVPLVDIAKAFDLTLTPRPGGYEMNSKAAPPPPPASVSCKIGEAVSNGQVTLTVVEVIQRKEYAKRYIRSDVTADRGHEIVVIICRLRNDTGREATLDVSGGPGTALSDTLGRSYAQKVGLPDAAAPGLRLQPQVSVEFGLIFQVPKDVKPQEFRYEPTITQDSNFKGALFRVALEKK
jgi:hypothetical protein